MRKVKYENLKPGMICEDWDHAGLKIVKVTCILRPTFKYDLIKVEFEDGSKTSATVGSHMNVRP